MRPYFEDSEAGITIYNADCLDVLDAGLIPPIDTIIADPPYCSGARQQAGARQEFAKSSREQWFLTDNMGTDTYVWWLRQIGQRLFALATMGAHLYCFTDWRQYTNVYIALESVGWRMSACLVWDKMRGGAMGSFWRNDHEFIVCLTKGPPRPLPNGSFFNVLHAVKPQGDEHPTVKPESIIRRLVDAGRGTILDPFMGSGTTLRAAKDMGLSAIGIEISEAYCEIAARRLSQSVLPLEVAGC